MGPLSHGTSDIDHHGILTCPQCGQRLTYKIEIRPEEVRKGKSGPRCSTSELWDQTFSDWPREFGDGWVGSGKGKGYDDPLGKGYKGTRASDER